MKKISIILFVLLTAVSCNDDVDKGKPAKPYNYPLFKNEYRVSAIEGKNKRWGEFKMKLFYNSVEMLDSAWVTNKNNRRIASITGALYNENGGKTIINKINDYIPAISADSIERMNLVFKEKYGENNYSLEDSIPKSVRTFITYTHSFHSDGRISKVKIEYNVPRKNLGISGVDFNSNYLLELSEQLIYEYNLDGVVTIVRILSDGYKVDFDKNTSTLDRKEIKKQIFMYNGNKIERVEDCILIAGGGFSRINDYLFHYNGENISSITNNTMTKTFTRSGNRLVINDGVLTMTYELDGKGYPLRIENEDGTFMNVTYEKGHGDFQNLTSLFDRAMGNPYIR